MLREFDDVFSEDSMPRKSMIGPPLHININYDQPVVPIAERHVRQVPINLKREAEIMIKDMLEAGIIRRVHEPTAWISPAMIIPKPNGAGVRLVVDYTNLNKAVRRPIHPFPSAADVTRLLHEDSRFSRLPIFFTDIGS